MINTQEPNDFYATIVVDGSPRSIEFRGERIGGPYEFRYTPQTPIFWNASGWEWSNDSAVLDNKPRSATGLLGKDDLLGPEDFPTFD